MPVSSCGRDLCVALACLGKGALCGLVSQDGMLPSLVIYLLAPRRLVGLVCIYVLRSFTPSHASARGAWSVVDGRCVDCGMRRRGRSAAVERVDPPVGSLFPLRGGDWSGSVLVRLL